MVTVSFLIGFMHTYFQLGCILYRVNNKFLNNYFLFHNRFNFKLSIISFNISEDLIYYFFHTSFININLLEPQDSTTIST